MGEAFDGHDSGGESLLEYSRTDVSSQSPTQAGGEVVGTREEMPPLPVHLEGSQTRGKLTIPARI